MKKLLVFLTLFLSSCATTDERLYVDFGMAAISPIVGNYIRSKNNPEKTAENIVLIAEGLKALVSSESISIAQLVSYAQSRYPSDYSIQEREEADAFLTALAAGLKSITLHGEPVGPEAMVQITTILDLVSKAAGRYVVPQASVDQYQKLMKLKRMGYRKLGRVMWA